jgi:hypothetical protein
MGLKERLNPAAKIGVARAFPFHIDGTLRLRKVDGLRKKRLHPGRNHRSF